MLEPVHTGLQEQIVKISGIFQASGQVGNLKLATVGVLTPQKLAITINQGFFFFFFFQKARCFPKRQWVEGLFFSVAGGDRAILWISSGPMSFLHMIFLLLSSCQI